MFNWLNWFNFKDCDLNYFSIYWLGIEKESLLTECVERTEILHTDR